MKSYFVGFGESYYIHYKENQIRKLIDKEKTYWMDSKFHQLIYALTVEAGPILVCYEDGTYIELVGDNVS